MRIRNARISIYEREISFIHAELDNQDIETISYLGRGKTGIDGALMYKVNGVTIFLNP